MGAFDTLVAINTTSTVNIMVAMNMTPNVYMMITINTTAAENTTIIMIATDIKIQTNTLDIKTSTNTLDIKAYTNPMEIKGLMADTATLDRVILEEFDRSHQTWTWINSIR